MNLPKIVKVLLLGFTSLGALALLAWIVTDGYGDWRRERIVSALIASQASHEQVIATFRETLIDYSIGSRHRAGFERWLAGTPDGCGVGVRERAASHPGVLYHTTAWTMTWLFFDDRGKLRAQYRCSQ